MVSHDVFTARALPVLVSDDGTRVPAGVDTDVTPMAYVDDDVRIRASWPQPAREPVVMTTRQRVAGVIALVLAFATGVLAVAMALALAA